MNRFIKTSQDLSLLAEMHDSVLVSYSGGKDSLVCLDLASRAFKRVVCFFMYLVPGLDVIERQLAYARDRYGVEVLYYPHISLAKFYKNEVFCPALYKWDNVKELNLGYVYSAVSRDTGIDLIMTGAKKADSLWRRTKFFSFARRDNVVHPLVDWNKYDVLAYLGIHNIPLPDSSGRAATGVDLSTPSLCWLYDNHPGDFRKLCEYFPYAESVIYRREWYGIE